MMMMMAKLCGPCGHCSSLHIPPAAFYHAIAVNLMVGCDDLLVDGLIGFLVWWLVDWFLGWLALLMIDCWAIAASWCVWFSKLHWYQSQPIQWQPMYNEWLISYQSISNSLVYWVYTPRKIQPVRMPPFYCAEVDRHWTPREQRLQAIASCWKKQHSHMEARLVKMSRELLLVRVLSRLWWWWSLSLLE